MTRGAHRSPAGGRDRLPRRPFHLPDELTCYFDTPDEPANIHLEMRIPGRLHYEAVRTAAAAAMLASLRASSRRARHGPLTRSYAWEHPRQLDLDPVSFTTFADLTELAGKRSAFIARSPSIDSSPPALLLVARGPDCDYLILNAHHATMDGLSWLELMRDLARRYRNATGAALGGTVTGAAASCPADAGGAPSTSATPVLETAADSARGQADGKPLRHEPAGGATARDDTAPGALITRLVSRLPARIAADGGGRRGCDLRLLLLPGVPAVRAVDSGEKVTLNDALITALVITVGRWNDEHGRKRRQVRVTVPFNARTSQHQDAAGNHSRIVTIAAMPSPPDADPGPLLLDVARQVRQARENPGPQVPAGSRRIGTAWCPAGMKRLMVRVALQMIGRLICDTAMVTNLGKVTSPPNFGLQGVTTMGLSGPAQMPRGLSIAAITAGDHVQIGLRYNRALLDAAAAARFLDGYAEALEALTSMPGTVPRATAAQASLSSAAATPAAQ